MTQAALTEVMRANIDVHTAMVEVYDQEPHFRPENQARVRKVLEQLSADVGGGKLLDIGCGTGFVIHLARDLFREIHGVDVTPAMLAKVDTRGGHITLHNQPAEELPFEDGSFDAVSSYAFIHHLENYSTVIAEAFRVLRPGGKLYVDLEPNRAFWQTFTDLEKRKLTSGETYSDIVEKEITAVLHTDEQVSEDFDIDPETFNQAEYTKHILGGVDGDEFVALCKQLGFSSCAIYPMWFLGQGAVSHGQSFEDAAVIEAYLQRITPLSTRLFKYLRFVATK